jgi:hypothetical protein
MPRCECSNGSSGDANEPYHRVYLAGLALVDFLKCIHTLLGWFQRSRCRSFNVALKASIAGRFSRQSKARYLEVALPSFVRRQWRQPFLSASIPLIACSPARPEPERRVPISQAHGLQPPIAGLPSPFATPRVRACCEVVCRHNARHPAAFEARHCPAAGIASSK